MDEIASEKYRFEGDMKKTGKNSNWEDEQYSPLGSACFS